MAVYNLNKRQRKYLARNIFVLFFSHFHLSGIIVFRHFENIMNILKDMWEKVEYIFLENRQFSDLSRKLKNSQTLLHTIMQFTACKGNLRQSNKKDLSSQIQFFVFSFYCMHPLKTSFYLSRSIDKAVKYGVDLRNSFSWG